VGTWTALFCKNRIVSFLISTHLPACVYKSIEVTMANLLLLVVLLSCVCMAFSASYKPVPDTSEKCTSCEKEIAEMEIKWGSEDSIDVVVAQLKEKCKEKEGKHILKRKVCDKVVDIFAEIPPKIFEGMKSLAWDIPLGACATLKKCKVECCGADSPPEQVHLSLAGEDRSLMGVTWVTLAQNETTVQYGLSADALSSTITGGTNTYTQAGWIGTIHKAILTGLTPATRYHYRVGSPSLDSWSEVFSFKTFDPAQPTQTYAVLADMSYDDQSDNTVAQLIKLVDAGKIDVVVHSGDISYADGYEAHWDTFFNKIQPIAARIPYMVTAGNHEFWYNFASYKARFFMPSNNGLQGRGSGDSMYYSWTYGNTYFSAMNSETAIDTPDFHKKQLTFFQDEVAKVDREQAPFVIAHFHRPVYCSNDGSCYRSGQPPNKLAKQAEDIFLNAKVDMCISGHVHDYERTFPTYQDKVVTTDLASKTYGAPIYIVQGASGNRENNKGEGSWPNPEPAWSAGHSSDIGYGLMVVEAAAANSVPTLHWTFYRSSDNAVLDNFTLSK